KGIIYTKIASDGRYIDFLKTNGGISRGLDNIFLKMQGREVFKVAVNKMCESIEDCLQILNLRADDIGIIVPHQANQRILEGVEKKLNLPENTLYSTIRKHGNTVAASIPLALYDAYKNGKIRDNDIVVFEALGAGITWGIVAVKW
ncbi:MAG: 3-oxoacyl-ACP synthase, partial [Rickettsiales bacterium]|nr:3-oxoacyl-ACP synthase [Rickettsiales bacterium]